MVNGAEPREDMDTPPDHDVWWLCSDGRKVLARTWFKARELVGGYGSVHNVRMIKEKEQCNS